LMKVEGLTKEKATEKTYTSPVRNPVVI